MITTPTATGSASGWPPIESSRSASPITVNATCVSMTSVTSTTTVAPASDRRYRSVPAGSP